MATWEKESASFRLINVPAGTADTTVHTVEVMPSGNTYPSGTIACIQCTSDASYWYPESDLDDDYNYVIYVDTQRKRVLPSPKANPVINI